MFGGNTVVLSVGEYGAEVAETFTPSSEKIFREERISNPSEPSAEVTIRKFDYSTGEESYLSYDENGKLYNSSYTDGKVSVLLRPGGVIESALIDPETGGDWSDIAEAIPEEFAESEGGDSPVLLHKGDQQMGIETDGEVLTWDRLGKWLQDSDRAVIISEGGLAAGVLGSSMSEAAKTASDSSAAKFLARWGKALGSVGIGATVLDEGSQFIANEKSISDAAGDAIGTASAGCIGGVLGPSVGGPVGAAVGSYAGALLYTHRQGIIDAVLDPADGAKKRGSTVAGWFKW